MPSARTASKTSFASFASGVVPCGVVPRGVVRKAKGHTRDGNLSLGMPFYRFRYYPKSNRGIPETEFCRQVCPFTGSATIPKATGAYPGRKHASRYALATYFTFFASGIRFRGCRVQAKRHFPDFSLARLNGINTGFSEMRGNLFCAFFLVKNCQKKP